MYGQTQKCKSMKHESIRLHWRGVSAIKHAVSSMSVNVRSYMNPFEQAQWIPQTNQLLPESNSIQSSWRPSFQPVDTTSTVPASYHQISPAKKSLHLRHTIESTVCFAVYQRYGQQRIINNRYIHYHQFPLLKPFECCFKIVTIKRWPKYLNFNLLYCIFKDSRSKRHRLIWRLASNTSR